MAIDTANSEQGPSELQSDLVCIDADKHDTIVTSTLQNTACSEQHTDADSRMQEVGETVTLAKVLDPCAFLDEHRTQTFFERWASRL